MARGGTGGGVCRFFLEGRCKFGDRCRYSHSGGGGNDYSRTQRSQPNPNLIDTGRRWNEKKGGNRYELYSSRDDRGGDGGNGGGRGGGGYGQSYEGRGRGGGDYGQSYGGKGYEGRGRGGGGYEGRGRGGGGYEGRGRGGGGYEGRGRGGRGRGYNQDSSQDRYHYSSPDYRHRGGGGGRGSRQDQFDSGSEYQNHQKTRHELFRGDSFQDGHKDHQSATNPDEIAVLIRNEMSGTMWPLSCYTYSKEVPCLPGFIEMSPQEIRFAAYTANSLGNYSSFLQNMEELAKKQDKVKLQYANITPEEVRKLQSMQNEMNQPTLFSSTSTTNDGGLFGPANTSSNDSAMASLFDAKTGPSLSQDSKQVQPFLLFQDTKSVFSQNVSQNPFFSPTQSQNSTSITATSTVPAHSQAGVHVDGLKQEDLEAFKADKFVLGKIPEHPPPLDLC